MRNPIPAAPWTDKNGTVHERELGANATRCLLACDGESNTFGAKVACDDCVRAGIVAYALSHQCGVDCHV